MSAPIKTSGGIISYLFRTQLKIWAIVRIQRCFRNFRKRREKRQEGERKAAETKERWKKKIEGEDYKPPPPPSPVKEERQQKKNVRLGFEGDADKRRQELIEEGDFYKSQLRKQEFGDHRCGS